MSVDFYDAALRHWEDGEWLHRDGRLPNADHLLGLAAECALKAVMQALDRGLFPDGAPQESRHRVHIDRLWDEFLTFAHDRNGARYATVLGEGRNPFADWQAEQRYYRRSAIACETVEAHRQATRLVMRVLQEAALDGVLP